ncbi:Aldehyde/histidinol dehydrogenase [Neurospora tetraspora]|uniref:Aldehyde/histidinol dehydrogenase n=1 Tax=Neurospora tetraspora TaxID=94610 RepID=A0AAE0J9S4_9PEZI|nr:Aldehyde/histidinol dehydrogenase [Neurospora tetraspora]
MTPDPQPTEAHEHSSGLSTFMEQPQLLYINGKSQPSSDGATFPVNNPMTGQHIYDCASASVDDYSLAIENAYEAYQSWSKRGPTARRMVFLKAADILDSYLHQDAGEIMSQEISAPDYWIRGEVIPTDRPGTTAFMERQPVGVVFGIAPWNAPVNLTARAVACPLICGNTVVLKPSEFSPKSQHLVVRALTAAGLPPGCLNFLPTSPERAPQVTEFAVKHPKVLRVNFTGSDRVGRIIGSWAAECVKQCILELGGKAPVIIFDDANIDAAVEAVVFGALSYSGQICMSTERVLLHRSISEKFKAKLLAKVATVKTGNHLEDSGVSLSGLFTPASARRVIDLVKSAVHGGGAKLLAGDLEITGPNKTIVRPHVLEGVKRDMDIAKKESFGPVIILSEFETDEEAVALANDSEFSLCASVFSTDVVRALDIARQVRAGACHINGPTVYVEATLPQGGTGGSSGYGRFGGMARVEAFTERKIVTLATSKLMYAF